VIETTQNIRVRVPINVAWEYVNDIHNWADLMPGLQHCDIVNTDDSSWVLKVGVGAMVRTVKVDVHVDQWDGPQRASFSFKLKGDPVKGGGSYVAVDRGDGTIDMALALQVEGSGPMAPMWEAMGGPLLPKFALAFAQQLAAGIERANGVDEREPSERPSVIGRIVAWLRSLWRKFTFTGAEGLSQSKSNLEA